MPSRKRETLITEKKLITRLFKKAEIASIDYVDYKFINRKKVVVYIPAANVEVAARAMAKAGAGKIGEYDNCSFRINGTGTFKPSSASRPYSGKKNKINYAEEIRLEMECGEDNINKVLDAMLAAHPYEEPAYEVYKFQKRTSQTNGIIITLKSKITLDALIKKFNANIEEQVISAKSINRIAIISGTADKKLVDKFKAAKASYLLSMQNNNYIINKL